jgi:hypothetical protein
MRPCAEFGSRCPTLAALAAHVRDELPLADRGAVAEAAMACARCQSLLKLGANLNAFSPNLAEDLALAEGGLPEQPRGHRLHPLALGIACGVSFVVALAMLDYVSAPGAHGGFFSRHRAADVEADLKIYPAPDSRVLTAPERLLWDADAHAPTLAAHVELQRDGLLPERLTPTRPGLVRLESAQALASGRYRWRVLDDRGQALAGPFQFEFRP